MIGTNELEVGSNVTQLLDADLTHREFPACRLLFPLQEHLICGLYFAIYEMLLET
jgi:hypothetical protein